MSTQDRFLYNFAALMVCLCFAAILYFLPDAADKEAEITQSRLDSRISPEQREALTGALLYNKEQKP